MIERNWQRQVHKLQMDLTSHCNAACAACVRNLNGGPNKPGLELKHLDLDLFKRIAIEDTKGWYIRQLCWNGNWGDCMMHPDIIEMVEIWTKYHPESMICIATNGALRSTTFWGKLAVALRQSSHHKVDFAMDGMEDTHKLYRRKTSHSKLSENIKAFTDAGGNGVVYMTMFEHNKHQIAEVREHARSLGVRMFKARGSFTGDRTIKLTGMNESNTKFLPAGEADYNIKAWYPNDGIDRYTENDKQIDQTAAYFPENELPNSDLKDSHIYNKIQNNWMEIFDIHESSKCPWKEEGEVQIDPWGIIWPCCHISLYGGGSSNSTSCQTGFIDLEKELAPGYSDTIEEAFTENNLNTRSLKEILNNNWFNKTVNQAIKGAEWQVCKNNCGICKD